METTHSELTRAVSDGAGEPDRLAPWHHRAWILCTPRSGSTLLANALNAAVGVEVDRFIQCPARHVFGEHFHPNFCATWKQFAELDPFVTKMHVHWLEERGQQMPRLSTKIIRLRRDDRVAQTWSLLSSGKVGQCHVRNSMQRAAYLSNEAHVSVTRKEFYDHFNSIERWQRLLQLLTCTRECLDVLYEDLVRDRARVLGQCMEYLALPAESWHVPTDEEIELVAIHGLGS